MNADRKAHIVWPDPGYVRGEFATSVLSMVFHTMDHVAGYTRYRSGPMLDRTRNRIVKAFLEQDRADWLLQIDSDMTFPRDTLRRMFEHADPDDVPVLGALTFGFKSKRGPFPVMYQQAASEFGYSHLPIMDYPKDQLIRVGAIGGAFVLAHRHVFEKIRGAEPFPWYGTAVVPFIKDGTPHQIGEDLSFCLRLAEHDIPIHVHTGIGTGHVKDIEWNEESYEANKDAFAAASGLQEPEADGVR